MKRRVALGVKAAVSIGVIAVLLAQADMGGIASRAAQADPALLLVAGLLAFAQIVIAAFRWMAVAGALGGRPRFANALRLVYIGQFFNLILPSTVGGDAVRVWLIWKSGMKGATAAASVFVDRLTAVLGLVVVMVAMTPLMPAMAGQGMVRLTVAGVAAGALGGVVVLMGLDRLPAEWRRFAAVSALAELSVSVRAVLLAPLPLLGSVGCGVLGQVNLSFSLYALALALGVPISAVDCLVLWPLVVLATLVPLSISGWGVREGAMVVALGLVGVPGDAALLLSLLIGLISTAVALPGGLVWLAASPEDTAVPRQAQQGQS